MHPAKVEPDLVTLKIHKGNATRNSQVIIKASTQNTKKQNKPIDLLPIINYNKLPYKN